MLSKAFGLSVCVSNLAQSEPFYTRLFRQAPERKFSKWVEFSIPGGMSFCLKERATTRRTKEEAPRVIFEVNDLTETEKTLKAEGFEFEQEFAETEDQGRFSNIVDPDGNLIGLYERNHSE